MNERKAERNLRDEEVQHFRMKRKRERERANRGVDEKGREMSEHLLKKKEEKEEKGEEIYPRKGRGKKKGEEKSQ